MTLLSGHGIIIDMVIEKNLSTGWNINDCMDGESVNFRIPCKMCIGDAGVIEASCLHENTPSRTSHAEVIRVKASSRRAIRGRCTEGEKIRHLLLNNRKTATLLNGEEFLL